MPLNSLTEPLGRKRAAHLLRRACFGASPSEIDTFAALTPAEAIASLFNSDLPDPALPIDPVTGNEWISTGPIEGGSTSFELEGVLNRWMIGQMLAVDVPESQRLAYVFRERIILFYHTLFTTKKSEVNDPRAIYFQNALFRIFAFDGNDVTVPNANPDLADDVYVRNIKKLTEKVSVDNAMLIFLDGRLNVNGNPNENYARELLELYSIGRGLEGNIPQPEFDGDYFYFTEQDVQEGAKVLSGFDNDPTYGNIDVETGLPRGVIKGTTIASRHDNSTKTFSQRFSGASISPDEALLLGTSATEGSVLDEITQFVDLIYNQTETALHICRRLYRFFVYHEIDTSLQSTTIQDMADILLANNFKVQPVLEALLTSTHFYDAEDGVNDNKFGGLIKSPLDLTVGFVRDFNIAVPSFSSDLTNFYEFTGSIVSNMSQMGMDFYEPFEVAGYPAYHQFPIFNRSWISPNYLTNRYSFIGASLTVDESTMGQVNVYDFFRNAIPIATGASTESFVIAIAEYFLPVSDDLSFTVEGGELTIERLSYFRQQILFEGNADPEAYWSERWTNGTSREDISQLLLQLINAMLQSPEYQLM